MRRHGRRLRTPDPAAVLSWAQAAKCPWLRRWKTWDRFFSWLFERTRRKHTHNFERWEATALALFVGVPLPLTGAWTGAAAAFVFGLRFRTALLAIAAGVVMAAAIVGALVAVGMVSLGG